MSVGRHQPPDDDVPRLQCGSSEVHTDHYYRLDGKKFRYLDDSTVQYCVGVKLESK